MITQEHVKTRPPTARSHRSSLSAPSAAACSLSVPRMVGNEVIMERTGRQQAATYSPSRTLQAKFLKFYYPSPDSSTSLPIQLLLSSQFSEGVTWKSVQYSI